MFLKSIKQLIMKEIRETLEQIAEAFKLGNVISFRTEDYKVKGYKVAYFNTQKENDLQYIFID